MQTVNSRLLTALSHLAEIKDATLFQQTLPQGPAHTRTHYHSTTAAHTRTYYHGAATAHTRTYYLGTAAPHTGPTTSVQQPLTPGPTSVQQPLPPSRTEQTLTPAPTSSGDPASVPHLNQEPITCLNIEAQIRQLIQDELRTQHEQEDVLNSREDNLQC